MASRQSGKVSEARIRKLMCEIGRRIWMRGLCAGNEGNHSYRLGKNRFIVTPTGMSKGFMQPDDLCIVDGDGNQISGKRKRSSEFLMHAAIYQARPDVNAVVHSHPPHATAFAVAGVEMPTGLYPEAELFIGTVKTTEYVTPGDQRLGASLLPHVKNSNTVLLANHGVVCFDRDLEQAYYNLEIVDNYARILLLAKQLGEPKPLPQHHLEELVRLRSKFGVTGIPSA